jgi:CheY-like chemotaxis protein
MSVQKNEQSRGGRYYRFEEVKALVVDDNRFVLTVLSTTLRGLGVGKVLTAENGEEAIKLLQLGASFATTDIDMIFSDHGMAPVSGMELLEWVRSQESDNLRFVPFIMMNGEADRRAVLEARDKGVTEYLAKPFSVNSIAERLLAVIDRPRPFVRAPRYFGPDRRRQILPYHGIERRVMDQSEVRVIEEEGTDDGSVAAAR